MPKQHKPGNDFSTSLKLTILPLLLLTMSLLLIACSSEDNTPSPAQQVAAVTPTAQSSTTSSASPSTQAGQTAPPLTANTSDFSQIKDLTEIVPEPAFKRQYLNQYNSLTTDLDVKFFASNSASMDQIGNSIKRVLAQAGYSEFQTGYKE